jgi:hypothetical protein
MMMDRDQVFFLRNGTAPASTSIDAYNFDTITIQGSERVDT